MMPESDYSSDDFESNQGKYQTNQKFYFLFALLQGLGLTCIVLVLLWTDSYFDGFAWDGSSKMFNWHPVLMVVGFVYLYGNAAVMYRVLQTQPKVKAKFFHISFNICALIASVIGLIAAFDYHYHSKMSDLYSIHSWVGMVTVILFSCQLLFGLLAFFFPKFSLHGQQRYMRIHVYFGAVIFALGITACISGITEKMIFVLKDQYQHLPAAAKVGNGLGVCIILFAMLVAHMLNKEISSKSRSSSEG